MQAYTVDWLSQVECPLANKFYRKHHFRGKAKRNESCAIVKDVDKNIIACAYLRNYDPFQLLAGVAVAPNHQGQGVARLLLQKLAERFDSKTYTFPYEHLLPLYESLGFVLVGADQLDQPISDLYHRYINQGRSILVMVYAG